MNEHVITFVVSQVALVVYLAVAFVGVSALFVLIIRTFKSLLGDET